jgi:4-alpha-glucanotransferase
MTTDPWGVDDGYDAVGGGWVPTPEPTRALLRAAMGADDGAAGPPAADPPLWFVRAGTAAPIDRPARLELEDGTEVVADGALPPDLPIGYHHLHPSDGGPTTRLVVSPERAAPVRRHLTALAVQLYAARSRASWGIGDLADAATVGRWASTHGVDALLLSPLHAPLPTPNPEPSPYFASSRCFRNPLHLRLEQVPGFDRASPALLALAEAGHRLLADRRIDRHAAWGLKRAALERIWEHEGAERARRDEAFARWRTESGPLLADYATFCALADHHGEGWTSWPEEHRHPASPAVARFAEDAAPAVDFHAWVQWLCDLQHQALAAGGPALVHDLAVGADPNGADGWLWQDTLALGVRVGAPPDEFNGDGQDWGLPPFVPWKLRQAGYEPLRQLLRASFRHAAGLRVDHVMGLFRLWWVPPGCGATEGGYVRQPGHELLDVLALESARAGAFVVGEDLGTVEDHVRAALGERGVLSYRVAWFEPDPPATWPAQSLASMTTHDLPTVAGVWSGTDDPDGEFRARLDALAGDRAAGTLTEVTAAAHGSLAGAPSQVVSATLEDLLGVAERPNRPGTTTERPNWSVALPVPMEDLERTGAATILDAMTSPTGGS